MQYKQYYESPLNIQSHTSSHSQNLPYTYKCTQSQSNNAKPFLLLGIIFNLSVLGFFKYTDFFLENFNLLSNLLNFDLNIPLPHILLPLALSFVTFQQIAFLIDCYKRIDISDMQEQGEQDSNIKQDSYTQAHKNNSHTIHFIDYALFISFFPQLIAGPIVHHKEMMPQFAALKNTRALIHWEHMAKGIFIFSIGLFKKVFIADSFAKWANAGFSVVESGGGLNIFESWATSLSYTFQLYFDFSGYCDMAIGLGLLFGIMLPINFNSPYKSLNISAFWRRWHMTLGRFLKEYVYIPLGGNKNTKYHSSKHYDFINKLLTLRNLFIVAFLSGIWHGAGWGFVIWGVLHGSAMCVHRIYGLILERFQLQKKSFLRSKIYKILCWILTFNFLNITWIFFRSENVSGAMNLIKGMFWITWVELPQKIHRLPALLEHIGGRNDTLIYIILAFVVCLGVGNAIKYMQNYDKNANLKCLFAIFLFTMSLLTMTFAERANEFLYFNF